MPVQRSVAVRNAMLDAEETAIGPSALLQLRSGPQPVNCAAADSGALIAQFTLPADLAPNASNGVKTWNPVSAITVSASGTIAHYRIKSSDGTVCHQQGSCGVAAGSPDLVIDNASPNAGQTVNVQGWTVTAPSL